MLLKADILKRIARGEVTLAFRRWTRPTVRAGGALRTSIGVLAIDSVQPIDPGDIGAREAALAGADSLAALKLALAARSDGAVYRIAFRLVGADPRIALRKTTALSREDMAALDAKLATMDMRADAPWTLKALARIGAAEGEVSTELARRLRMDRAKLKVELRKLKELGLIESLDVGYRLAPRGKAHLKRR